MKYIAVVLLMVAAMSAQNAPSTNKGARLDIPAISREAHGAVVSIVVSDKNGHPVAQGSGFPISKDGQVVTNYHVIKNGSSAVVKLPDGAFFAVDGVLASDKDRDVARLERSLSSQPDLQAQQAGNLRRDGGRPTGIIIGRLVADDSRFLATTEDEELTALLIEGEPLGRKVRVQSFDYGNRCALR